MNKRVMQMGVLVALALVGVGFASAAESAGLPPTATEKTELDKLVGQPVDIAPWAYAWRADLAVQEKPEAYFIPRRLERIDKVYRTAFYALPEQELKSKYYQMPDLLQPLLPQPEGRLLAGLLWTGRVGNCQVELHWPGSVQEIPSPDAVEVRVYPTSFGWFGWTVDKILSKPEVSGDRRTWTYERDPAAKMDWAFSSRVDAATEMVAVFYKKGEAQGGTKCAVPSIRVICPSMGVWKRMDVEIEWGFQAGKEKTDFDGWVESYVAMTGPVWPLAEDKGTTTTGGHTWQSRAAGGSRRGIVVPLLYAPSGRPALDSRITVWTKMSGFTFRPGDLENGPILIPEHGVFVTKVGSGKTARQFARELAAKNLKSICQMTREHREAASWEEVMREVRLSTCPAGTVLPPLPKVDDPPMEVQLPDARWTDAWRAASFQLKGKHMWGGLAYEVGRVAHEMDLVGLHEEAAKVYEHFLKAPGAKSDGDYADGNGALEWATGMRHDMGYDHDGTHASTGRLLFAMADRFFLTGDKEWFQQNRVRMQAAADWIIRQRNLYMKDIPNRQDLLVAGLMPPCMLGDYALPSCDWRWYYADNAFALQGLRRFADALTEFDPEAGRKYRAEADAFRRDIRRAVEREAALSPVRLGRNGTYRSFIPLMAYARGAMSNLELGAPQRPQADIIVGALPLAEPFGALDANDIRIVGTLNVMEEIGMSPKVTTHILAVNVLEEIGTSVSAVGELDDAWFWNCYGGSFPKASHNANIYLLQDDVPNFLRFWMNCYAALVGADGKLWEWGQLGQYTNCNSPDNGTAGWFMENFRNLLVMEDGQSLWVARATPRVWLEQGKRVAVKNAPSYFGTLAYEIISDVDNGKITATVEIPSRNPPKSVVVRFRHPTAVPMKSVLVNGQAWTGFDKDKEVIELMGLTGKVAVAASY
ncbi:MAG: hypothetical protein A2V98_17220 [Planctomycetes bacterium RBG_16_64_12]|nr:MAG: hypothetical protein A2V98_17220 [Planctomycetes bacterium RBG_16_64_12]